MSVRLKALLDAPEAFLTQGTELDWGEPEWRRSAALARWVTMVTGGGDTIAVAKSSRESGPARHLEAVWVDPEYRRRRIATQLVEWLIDQEIQAGIEHILIWVINTNHAARQLYEGIGFKPTGEVQPIDRRGERLEERLKLPIDSLRQPSKGPPRPPGR